ncbi:hypothetical protein K7432_012205 [Basidiobolus ranarum]|uniref:Uncharacterized protein n=1 Tax=Basidiobolus ranarum TaxID=34480 RepID=A0ABR2WL37_9FUNG
MSRKSVHFKIFWIYSSSSYCCLYFHSATVKNMTFLTQAARRTAAVSPRRFYASSAPQQQRSKLRENLKKLGETKVGDFVTDSTRPFLIVAGVAVVAKFIIGS